MTLWKLQHYYCKSLNEIADDSGNCKPDCGPLATDNKTRIATASNAGRGTSNKYIKVTEFIRKMLDEQQKVYVV